MGTTPPKIQDRSAFMKAMLKNPNVAAKKTATAQRNYFERLHSLPAKFKDAVCHLDFSKPKPVPTKQGLQLWQYPCSRCSKRPMPPAKVFSLPRLCGSRSSKVTAAECKLHLLGPERVKRMNAKSVQQAARFKASLGVAEMRRRENKYKRVIYQKKIAATRSSSGSGKRQ